MSSAAVLLQIRTNKRYAGSSGWTVQASAVGLLRCCPAGFVPSLRVARPASPMSGQEPTSLSLTQSSELDPGALLPGWLRSPAPACCDQELAAAVKADYGSIDILVHSLANGPEVRDSAAEPGRVAIVAPLAPAWQLISPWPAARGAGRPLGYTPSHGGVVHSGGR